jgi:hypothetical protein
VAATSRSLLAAVDLARYPLDRPRTDDYRALCVRIRRELDATGVSILPAFLTETATARLVDESAAIAPLAHHSDVPGTPYLELPADGWPAGHPRVTWGHTSLGAVAYDDFPPDSVLRQLYESDTLLAFLGDALGFAVYRYDDPLGGLNLAVMRDGDELYWHFDQTDFVVSLAIQSSSAGGEFEYAPMIRDAGDERYDDVAALLAGRHAGVVKVPMTPGTLMLFEGRHSIHRVTPIRGTVPRYVGLFGYDRKPGTCSSELLREIRYGRTA